MNPVPAADLQKLHYGALVRVVRSLDPTMPSRYRGRAGRVREFVTDDHGATPASPLVVLHFRNLGRTHRRQCFWLEELEVLNRTERRHAG